MYAFNNDYSNARKALIGSAFSVATGGVGHLGSLRHLSKLGKHGKKLSKRLLRSRAVRGYHRINHRWGGAERGFVRMAKHAGRSKWNQRFWGASFHVAHAWGGSRLSHYW
jgi:hypothetical protein